MLSAFYICCIFRLDFIMEVNTMNPDPTNVSSKHFEFLGTWILLGQIWGGISPPSLFKKEQKASQNGVLHSHSQLNTQSMYDQQSLSSACAYAQSDQSLCMSLEYSMRVKLLTEHHLEFLSLKGGCTGSSESTHVKIPHCWKSHVMLIYGASCTCLYFSCLGGWSKCVQDLVF